jgi:hypothetical protein
MPIEGISMSSVFSLVTVGVALSMAVYLGASYLSPSFDIAKVISSVAYDIAAMYDIAYTLPGEVTIYYYGPGACKWNYNQPSDDASSFHCYSGEAVLIQDVFFSLEEIHLTNDPYMIYDEDEGNIFLPPDTVPYPRPSLYSIVIPYYDAQICPYNDILESCALAQAPFAASYSDLTTLNAKMRRDEIPYEVPVQDWSFVVTKQNVGNYYNTVDIKPETPDTLTRFLGLVSAVYNMLCNDPLMLHEDKIVPYSSGTASVTFDSVVDLENDFEPQHFVHLFRGRRWRVYDSAVLCQERLVWDGEGDYETVCSDACQGTYNLDAQNYISCVEECKKDIDCEQYCYVKLIEEPLIECEAGCDDNYIIEYCFDINSFAERKGCGNVNKVRFSSDFINYVNNEYTYFASFTSCIKPYLWFETSNGELVVDAVSAELNVFTGECEND